MYKVFIENVPIYFQKNKQSKTNLPKRFFPSLALHDFERFVDEIHALSANESIFVTSDDPSLELSSFFKNFQWIEAAGGVVRNNKTDALLFIFRNGIWDLPKGKIENGETPQEGALREIEEECCIRNMEIESQLSPTYHIYFAYEKYWIKKTYWFALTSSQIELQPQKEENISEATWFSENKIESVRKNTFKSILDVIDEYLS